MRRNLLPLLILTSLLGLICGANYLQGTWLTGWDNLHPEFNFFLNVKRSLFAVWQEYQGPGLLGGMGHAAALPREILLWMLSFILPPNILRYAWTFGMLGLGSIGAYILINRFVLPKMFPSLSASARHLGSLFGGLYALTNLATAQMFLAPFEAFITHYGFLPWFFISVFLFFQQPTKKHLLFILLVHLCGATSGYIPTLFTVYFLSLLVIGITVFLISSNKQVFFRTFATAVGTILVANAFWLLPFIYFTATASHVNVEAKINQMATEEIFLRNRAYGTLNDTIRLQGFWFDTLDFNPDKSLFEPVFNTWRSYVNVPVVQWTMLLLFCVILLGVFSIVHKKERSLAWLLILFFVSILFLTTDTQPFAAINDWLRTTIPLFRQAFRFPFTKFSLLAGLIYSLAFGIGCATLLHKEKTFVKKTFQWLVLGAVIFGLGAQTLPILQGRLFYSAVKQNIPQEYFSLFDFFKHAPPGRITKRPQHTYWGWAYYQWGYSGSGFPWYGIEQPMTDRAFDVWTKTGENYYWELSYALYSKNPELIDGVFRKWDIRYIFLDENVVSPSNNRALFVEETKTLLAALPDIKQAATIGNLTIYERTNTGYDSFVSLVGLLPKINAFASSDIDMAYQDFGHYIGINTKDEASDVLYPFRTLFTKRAVNERDFTVEEADSSFTISPATLATSASILKSLVYDSTASGDLRTDLVKPCGALSDGEKHTKATQEKGLYFENFNTRSCLSFEIPTLSHRDGYLVAVESKYSEGRAMLLSFINQTTRHVEMEAYLPKTLDWQTTYFVLPPLASDGLGYNLYITNDSIGRQKTINELRRIRIYTIPYNELTHLRTGTAVPAITKPTPTVYHPNPSFYKVSNIASGGTLLLSQSFDSGWIAYDATENKFLNHILVNNWQNGWIINPGTNSTIYIFFWPQLLEFLGFALLPLPFLFSKKLASRS